MTTSQSVIKYQGGRGFVLMKLSDSKSIKLNLSDTTLTATHAIREFRGGDSNFPLAYALGDGTASVEGTLSEVIDELAFRDYMGYDKYANTNAVKGKFKVVATVSAGSVDLTGGPEGIPSGGSVVESSVYVRLNDTGVDLADTEYTIASNTLTGLTAYNGRVLVVEGIYTMAGYEWAFRTASKGACTELWLVFPLADYDCTAEQTYRVIYIPRAFVIPDAEISSRGDTLAAPVRFRVAPDAAGYLWYESLMDNPEENYE